MSTPVNSMHSFTTACKDLFFPPRCLGCEQQLESSTLPLLCDQCLADLSLLVSPLCTCCGTPFPSGEDHLCVHCLNSQFAFDFSRSVFRYQEPLTSLLLQLKFANSLVGLATMAELVKESRVTSMFREPDIVLPVPLHISRLRSRGFNQSLMLARTCFPQWQDRIRVRLLVRHRATTPQTRLTGKVRRNNLKNAFSVAGKEELACRKILLVDDVFTTGSTLHECAKVLSGAGAARVETFTLARAV